MVLQFDTHGNEKQKQAARNWLDESTTEIVYGGSKGSGKSYLGVALNFGDALIYPDTHYFIARKKLNDLRKFTIPSIHEVLEHWGVSQKYYKFNGQDNLYNLYNGSKVYLLEAKFMPSDPMYQRFGSMQMTRGWIEEAGEFEIEAKMNLAASIGRWNNDKYNLYPKLLMTCNPSKNFLYKDFYKPFREGTLQPHQIFVQALPTDNKKLDKNYLENLERILSSNEKDRLLYGNWEYDDDPMALCEYDAILDLFNNIHVSGGRKYITVDAARFGSDKAKIGIWEGWRLIEVISMDISKTTEISEICREKMKQYGIPKRQVICDEDGVGGGIVDQLGCKGFVNNSKALDEDNDKVNYYNLQSQCCFKTAKLINNSGIWIKAKISEKDKEEIIEEFEQLKREDSEGKLKILPKDKIKSLIGRSPDWRDMIMMRMWFDIAKTGRIITVGSSSSR